MVILVVSLSYGRFVNCFTAVKILDFPSHMHDTKRYNIEKVIEEEHRLPHLMFATVKFKQFYRLVHTLKFPEAAAEMTIILASFT